MNQDFAAFPVVQPCNVLVVDDEAALSRLLRRVLEDAGYNVVETHDPTAALALAENLGGDIDLLIADVIMPRMSGSELHERLRQKFPQMQVIYISGYDQLEPVVAKASVRELFLPKPFTPAQLKRAVASALERRAPFSDLTPSTF